MEKPFNFFKILMHMEKKQLQNISNFISNTCIFILSMGVDWKIVMFMYIKQIQNLDNKYTSIIIL